MTPTGLPAHDIATFLKEVLDPQTVAIVGASATPNKAGGRVLHNVLTCGFKGRVLPINPHHDEVQGVPCLASIREADSASPPELAFVSLPSASGRLLPALLECAEAGVKCCVVNATGFAEVAEVDVAGPARQGELLGLVKSTGMRLIGPNCLGLMSARCSLNLTSGWSLSVSPVEGPVGIISQSGSIMMHLYHVAADLGSGITSSISVGNQADLEVSDFLEAMVADTTTRVICVYLEGLKDADRFLTAADRCFEAGKPLLVLKTGRTLTGSSVTRSHTASLTSSGRVFESVCREHGIVVVDDPDTMVRAAVLFAERGRPTQDGVGVLSSSGGGAAIALDRVVEAGLHVPAIAKETAAALGEHVLLPSDVAVVDLGRRQVPGGTLPVRDIAGGLASDLHVGVVLYCVTVMPHMVERTLEMEQAVREAGKLFVPTLLPGSAGAATRLALRANGIECFDHLDDALRLIRAWTSVITTAAPHPHTGGFDTPEDVLRNLEATPSGRLTEGEIKEVVGWYGIPSNVGELANSDNELIAAAGRIGYPVALKVSSRVITHKSEVGGVRLSLSTPDDLVAAYHELQVLMAGIDEHAQFLVQQMAPPALELLAGLVYDEQFGPVMTVGFGGRLTEYFGDISTHVAPISEATALGMLRNLKIWPVLDDARGQIETDVEALVAALSDFSRLGRDLGPRLVELELNPLLVLPPGQGVLAIDGRGTLH